MKTVLVTGASGFVGSALVKRLAVHAGYFPRAAVRKVEMRLLPLVDVVQVGNLNSTTDWITALDGVSSVIHLAARAHILKETLSDPLEEFRKINVEGALNLAQQAAETGVNRFIFISSIGVNGNNNTRPFTENDIPNPDEPYARSKFEAECGLRQIAEETGMELVIIRPTLVYGPNAPGNFGKLFNAVCKGIPLPLGAIHNQRSLIGLDNLIDLITSCIDHPSARNQTFLASDGEDLSTTELLKRIAKALGRRSLLIPVPVKLLEMGALLLRRQDVVQRLCGSLQVDITKARTLLGWNPPVSVDEGLLRTAQGFLYEKTV